MDNISVQITDLPINIDGLTVKNEDDSYTIFLNARSSVNQQREAYEHELRHIDKDDFQKADVQAIEAEAHGSAPIGPAPEAKEPDEFLINLRRSRAALKKQIKKKERELQDLEWRCWQNGIDLNDYLFRKAEDEKLYGGM